MFNGIWKETGGILITICDCGNCFHKHNVPLLLSLVFCKYNVHGPVNMNDKDEVLQV